MKIKDWKIREIQSDMRGGFIEEINGIVRETEKACLVSITWGYNSNLYRTVDVWVPKSCILSDEQAEAERRAESERFERAAAAYEALVKFAKGHGVKDVRVGMRKATILEKCRAAGVEFTA